MTSSKKTAYVANGEDLDQPFEDNALLNAKGDHPFEDPPWRVLEGDVVFEPMPIQVGAVTEEGFVPAEEAQASPESAPVDPERGEPDSEQSAATTDDEWAEVATPEPTVVGVPEEEVESRIEHAVAEAKAATEQQFPHR
jgi:hypothetical protein